jgi:hypothetical protein
MREPRHVPIAAPNAAGASGAGGAPKAVSWTMPFRIAWSAIRGVMEGALPLVILVCVLALFWEVLTIVRYVTAPNGFALTQQVETIVAEGGLVISLVVYLIAGLRTLRGVRDRQDEGEYVEAWVALAVLGLSIIVAIVPVLTLLATAQHPAP